MPSQDAASHLLQPLAGATLDALLQAQAHHARVREVVLEAPELEPAAFALSDGVDFWLHWSSQLSAAYGRIPSVQRDPSHPLQHVWTIGRQLTLVLKSDASSLTALQPELPGLEDLAGGFVALCASPNSSSAAFAGISGGQVNWRTPVQTLASPMAPVVQVERPRTVMRSRRGTDDQALGS